MPAALRTFPNLRALAQDFLGHPYREGECWQLVRDLLQAGGLGSYQTNPEQALADVDEIWFWDDVRDPLTLTQPWDWFLVTKRGAPDAGAPIGHIGLVVDDEHWVHVAKAGVCIDSMRRWRHKLVQLARLRALA